MRGDATGTSFDCRAPDVDRPGAIALSSVDFSGSISSDRVAYKFSCSPDGEWELVNSVCSDARASICGVAILHRWGLKAWTAPTLKSSH